MGASHAGPDQRVFTCLGHAIELGSLAAFRAGDAGHERKQALLGPVYEIGGAGVTDAEVIAPGGPDEMEKPVGVAQEVRVAEKLRAHGGLEEHAV